MADITITAANVIASSRAVHRREYTFAATVTAGQVVYLNASNQWALADMNGLLGTATTSLIGIAANSGSLNQPADVVTSDPLMAIGATVVSGTSYYLSDTAGGISATVPTTGDQPVFLGLGSGTASIVVQFLATGVTI